MLGRDQEKGALVRRTRRNFGWTFLALCTFPVSRKHVRHPDHRALFTHGAGLECEAPVDPAAVHRHSQPLEAELLNLDAA